MTKPRTYKTQAIVTKKTKLGEADRILTLYSLDMGKIQGVAKAVRRPDSRLSGHLELLTYSEISLVSGKNIDTIIGSQTINTFLPVRNNLEKLSFALYMIDLVNSFTSEETADPHLFNLLLNSLEELTKSKDCYLLLRYFELKILKNVGYRPELDKCVLCRRPAGDNGVTFSPSAGGVICPSCLFMRQHYGYKLTPNGLRLLRRIQATEWPELNQTPIDTNIVLENERLLRSYIRYLLERDVKSATWLEELA
jgi:DNA repair protein RecO (recombination protein O)